MNRFIRSVNRFIRHCAGSTLVEFTVVFPVFMLVAFGTVDVTYMLYDWALANKAAYVGAHRAIISNPVALGITNLSYNPLLLGRPCFNSATGEAIGNCPSVQTECVGATIGGTCSVYPFDDDAFVAIFNRMQTIFPRLQRQNVTISYQTNNLGFVGRPDGLPMNVTVAIKCMTHQFFFINALMQWVFTPQSECPGPTAGPPLPAFATTLTSESMVTN